MNILTQVENHTLSVSVPTPGLETRIVSTGERPRVFMVDYLPVTSRIGVRFGSAVAWTDLNALPLGEARITLYVNLIRVRTSPSRREGALSTMREVAQLYGQDQPLPVGDQWFLFSARDHAMPSSGFVRSAWVSLPTIVGSTVAQQQTEWW